MASCASSTSRRLWCSSLRTRMHPHNDSLSRPQSLTHSLGDSSVSRSLDSHSLSLLPSKTTSNDEGEKNNPMIEVVPQSVASALVANDALQSATMVSVAIFSRPRIHDQSTTSDVGFRQKSAARRLPRITSPNINRRILANAFESAWPSRFSDPTEDRRN